MIRKQWVFKCCGAKAWKRDDVESFLWHRAGQPECGGHTPEELTKLYSKPQKVTHEPEPHALSA